MGRRTFDCWVDEADVGQVITTDARTAAEEYVERLDCDGECSDYVDVSVRDEDGYVSHWIVCREHRVTYTARARGQR